MLIYFLYCTINKSDHQFDTNCFVGRIDYFEAILLLFMMITIMNIPSVTVYCCKKTTTLK